LLHNIVIVGIQSRIIPPCPLWLCHI